MKSHELIEELGRVLQLPDLALDDSNVCRVIFDGHPVDFETLPDSFDLFLIAEIGPVPPAPSEAASFRRMLEGNRYGLETGGATLCIDSDRDSVVLYRQLDVEHMDFPLFEQKLEVFFERLKYWKDAYQILPSQSGTLAPEDFGSHLIRI